MFVSSIGCGVTIMMIVQEMETSVRMMNYSPVHNHCFLLISVVCTICSGIASSSDDSTILLLSRWIGLCRTCCWRDWYILAWWAGISCIKLWSTILISCGVGSSHISVIRSWACVVCRCRCVLCCISCAGIARLTTGLGCAISWITLLFSQEYRISLMAFIVAIIIHTIFIVISVPSWLFVSIIIVIVRLRGNHLVLNWEFICLVAKLGICFGLQGMNIATEVGNKQKKNW